MMGWCPYDGEECHHDGYCKDCAYSKKEEKKCENCANCSPWDGYCGLGNNEEARDRGVCERWESK